nr:hypothetical protein [Pontixanthobacter gangjinensis]
MVPLLGACATTLPPPSPGTTPQASVGLPSRPATPPPTQPEPPLTSHDLRMPRIMSMPGLEGVIGADSASLRRQFGTARLNVREGDARKLQFTSEACVLDVYLYPLSRGAEPTVTYVDARRASDGLDVDRASCVAALRR